MKAIIAFLAGALVAFELAAIHSENQLPTYTQLVRAGLGHFAPRCPTCDQATVIALPVPARNRRHAWHTSVPS